MTFTKMMKCLGMALAAGGSVGLVVGVEQGVTVSCIGLVAVLGLRWLYLMGRHAEEGLLAQDPRYQLIERYPEIVVADSRETALGLESAAEFEDLSQMMSSLSPEGQTIQTFRFKDRQPMGGTFTMTFPHFTTPPMPWNITTEELNEEIRASVTAHNVEATRLWAEWKSRDV